MFTFSYLYILFGALIHISTWLASFSNDNVPFNSS